MLKPEFIFCGGIKQKQLNNLFKYKSVNVLVPWTTFKTTVDRSVKEKEPIEDVNVVMEFL